MEKQSPVRIVTKKHPGRVAQGHKLAALMKSRKQELRAEKSPVQSPVLQPEQAQVVDGTNKVVRDFWLYGGIILLAAAGSTYYCYIYKTPAVSQAPTDEKKILKKYMCYCRTAIMFLMDL